MEPSISQQISDHQGQREKLAAFFRRNPFTIYSQETLADACGCAVSTVRTRIGELSRVDGLSLRWHQSGYRGTDGKPHIECKRWEFVERPAEPLGRDGGDRVPARAQTLFDLSVRSL